jgi:hypothetical protein
MRRCADPTNARDAVFRQLQRDVHRPAARELIGDARPLTRRTGERASDGEREVLDGRSPKYRPRWTVDRIAPLDLNVLRVALYRIWTNELWSPYELGFGTSG